MNKVVKRYLIVYGVFVLLVALDYISKVLSVGVFDKTIISGVLSFSYTENVGAAWSMFSGYTIILAILSVVFVALAVVFDIKTKTNKTPLYNVAFTLILAGAFGNAIDRVFLHYVRDFIRLDFINFPIFNLADTFLVVGVIMLAIYILFNNSKNKDSTKENNIKE